MKQTFKTCLFDRFCVDPCNQASRDWRENHVKEMQPRFPGHDFGKADVCSLLGRCKMEPGSSRCRSYRCKECRVWMSKDIDEGITNREEYVFASMLATAGEQNEEEAD